MKSCKSAKRYAEFSPSDQIPKSKRARLSESLSLNSPKSVTLLPIFVVYDANSNTSASDPSLAASSASSPISTPPPANTSTPNVPPQTHNVGSPQTPKSPKTKAPVKPRQQPQVYKHPSTPTTGPTQIPAPAPTNSAKRPREEEESPPPNVRGSSSTLAASSPSGATDEPSPPKRVKTDWERSISGELQKKTGAVESIRTDEDASRFFEKMVSESVSNSDDGTSSVPAEFCQTLGTNLRGVGATPDNEDSSDMSSILGGDIIGRSSPCPFEFLDFSSFGGGEYDSEADTSDLATYLSQLTSCGSESTHESDPTLQLNNGEPSRMATSFEGTDFRVEPKPGNIYHTYHNGRHSYYHCTRSNEELKPGTPYRTYHNGGHFTTVTSYYTHNKGQFNATSSNVTSSTNPSTEEFSPTLQLNNRGGPPRMATNFEGSHHRWNAEPSEQNEPGDGSTSTANGNTMFSQSSEFTINNGQFSNVSGDQINHAHSHSSSYTFVAPQAFQMLQPEEPIPTPIPEILTGLDEGALPRVLNQVSRWSYERISSFDADTLKIFVLLACLHFGPKFAQAVTGHLPSRNVLTLAG
ncbi:hypothetical protein VNI00_005163 [Paramarasmius palmivorus]|uniref:Uncharacterized protein n=1 Tax=Paramarasmius palmivorus TaxID=297713 RepID=A0AAW0DEP0_9AGAR